MSKKIFFLRTLLVLSFVPPVAAEQVSVEGTGGDRQSAIADAKRAAVNQVVGTYIDSRTLVSDSELALDEILTKSVGFVTDVQILRENNLGGVYTVQALVNVSKESELTSRLQTIMSLNDPRIAVIVLREGTNQHEDRVESAIMDSLIEMGFGHVVDADITAGLNNAQMLRSLYEGRGAGQAVGSSFGADFIVMGKTNAESNQVMIPDFKGGYKTTALNSGRAEMTAKIIRLDSGDVLSTFTVDAKGMETNRSYAEREAMKNIAVQAAAKVEEKFRRLGAKTDSSVQITAIIRGGNDKLQQLVEDLKSVPGVGNVFMREQKNGRAIISVDTAHNANTVVQMLKSRTRLNIFADSIGGASATLIVS